MSESIAVTGACLCGAVKLSARNMQTNAGACHCGMCRKWGGGPLIAVDCGQDVKIKGEDAVSLFDSSDWAQRGFCKHCGTHLFYRLKESRQYIVSAGIFDANEQLVFDHQVFIDEKPHYYSFSNETKNMTGAEVFAMYGEK